MFFYLTGQNDLLAKIYLCFLFSESFPLFELCCLKSNIGKQSPFTVLKQKVILEFNCIALVHQIMLKLDITLHLGSTKLGCLSLIPVFSPHDSS